MNHVTMTLPMSRVVSANHRLHWGERAYRTKVLRELGKYNGMSLPKFERARIVVHVGWPDRRRRDAANLHPTIKAIVDGMIDGGLLPDDSDAYLTGPDLRPYVAGIRGQVVLTFDVEDVA